MIKSRRFSLFQSLPTLSNICRQRYEPTLRVESYKVLLSVRLQPRLGWKWLTMTKTLAYYFSELITAEKAVEYRPRGPILWTYYSHKMLPPLYSRSKFSNLKIMLILADRTTLDVDVILYLFIWKTLQLKVERRIQTTFILWRVSCRTPLNFTLVQL